jgi:hypothetical protein
MGHHHGDDEVDQPDLRANFNNRDLRHAINNRHRERDEAEREQQRKYDEEYAPLAPVMAIRADAVMMSSNNQLHHPAPAVLDDDIGSDLDGFSAFSNPFRGISWSATYKPVGIDKFDGDSDPKTWIRTYSVAIHAANGNNDIIAAVSIS